MKEKTQLESQQAMLNQLLPKLRQKRVSDRVRALESLAKIDLPRVVNEMIRALSDRSPTVRATAAEFLGSLEAKEAVRPLIGKLADSDNEVRMMAASSLGSLLMGKRSPLKLIQTLQDRDELVRIEVAESLGAIGDRRALPALWKALDDPSPLVRSYLAAAIGELGNKGDVAKLEERLKQEKFDTSKVGYYQALYRLGRHDALEALFSILLKSSDYRVRSATAKILSEVIADESNAPAILRALQKALRQEQTIAAKSSIRSSLKRVRQKVAMKNIPNLPKRQSQTP
jgi:HEAT repeat protein